MKSNTKLCLSAIAVWSLAITGPSVHATPDSPEDEPEGQVVLIGESTPPAAVENSRLARLLEEARFSSGVTEVAKMADGGADPGVLTSHVLSSEASQPLRAEDISHLRSHAVPDDVISLMIEQRAENRDRQRAEAAEAPPAPPAPTVTFVPAPRPLQPPASTVTVIGGSGVARGLSYRRYYYSRYNYYSPRRYGSLYASFGNYGRYSSYGRYGGRHAYQVCR